MTDHTSNDNIPAQMLWAHKHLGSWRAVAALCGTNPRTGKPVGAALAWHYAMGRRAIPDAVVECWQESMASGAVKTRKRKDRVSIEVSPEVRRALRSSIKQPGDTWDDAFNRVLADTEPGSVPHLLGYLFGSTIEAMIRDLEYPLEAPQLYATVDTTTINWWLDRMRLELSMRKTPDWVRKD